MESNEYTNQLLQCLIQVISRISMPAEKVQEIVGSGKKQIKAYNLCDGTNSQTDISKKTGIDVGNLNRTINRWVQNGIVFKVGESKDIRFIHVYPISETVLRKK